ncbi:MAG: HAMP domain-containing histidine kinase [Lachnospiraceae bacterium]|nr:HAMP domain-containing histidine kinase [Lachnospiraceae bacterium]
MKRIAYSVWKFILLFAFLSFVITCNFLLFMQFVPLEEAELDSAASLTMFNVIFLTLIICILYEVYHRWRVRRPVKRILDGMEKIVEGDFSARIPYLQGEDSDNEYDEIIKGLNHLAEELSGVETLRTDFISNVSHELKTPLAVIQNYGTILQNPALSEKEQMEYAKAITEQTRKLSALITNILKLNRLENQQIFPEKQDYNLSEQICECLLGFEQAWEKKNLEIETDMDEDVLICQDAELLSLVWNNLFSNAVKFCREEGKVSVSVKKEKNGVLVSVSDEGCGISPEVGAHIFEKFYQGDTSHATQGNGLGLALVKRVIDIVGGEIHVQSVLGKGSTFLVRLGECE